MNVKELTAKFNQEYGKGHKIAAAGMVLPPMKRIPLGLFAFDIATGGGIPMNRVTMIFGTEGSGKTNLSLCAIREYQKRYPMRPCVFIDVEGNLEQDWATRMGVDYPALTVIRPDYAEQIIDMTDDLLTASDIGLVVLDSIASMGAQSDLEGSMKKDTVGRNPLLVSRFMRKVQHRFIQQARGEIQDSDFPSLLLINQIRSKVGIVFGSPEVTPGGMAQGFAQALRIRLHGKYVIDTDVHPTIPVRKHITGKVQKHRCPIVSTKFEFEHVMWPHKTLQVGYAYDWPSIKDYTENYGLLSKVKGGYKFAGKLFKTQKAIAHEVSVNPALRDEVMDLLMKRLLDNPLNVSKGVPTKVK
jgi:protein RecA